jgi:hypothetical protein
LSRIYAWDRLGLEETIHGWYPALRCDAADEEKKQLSYLGSMLRREPTEEEAEQEAEQQRVLDWAGDTGFKGKGEVPTSQEKDIQSEDG